MVESNAIRELVGALSPDDEKKKSDTYSAVVSHIDEEGTVWVILAGSDKETPTASTSTEVKKGDSVTVQWRNNKLYIGGNYSNPSAGVGTVMPSVDFVTELIDKDITVNSINAATGYIGELTSKNITAEDLTADHATIKELDVEAMAAATAYIGELTADNITAEDIATDHATIGDLDANYAQIDAANVTDLSAQNAWVNKIMVQTGLIAHEGTVFTLDAIQVNAANITAGTLDVNRLIVTVDGQKYLVNINPSTGTPTYEKLDGNIVEPRTITADRIVAHDITVQEITTENLVGTNGWINLNQGKFFYTTNGSTWANTTNGIMWDGTSLKIKGDVNITAGNVYTKTQTDTALGGKVGNNEVITKINASSEGVQIQASKVDIAGSAVFNNYSTTTQMNTAIGNAVDAVEVGGKNLLSDTRDFGTKNTTDIWLADTGVSALTTNKYNGTIIRNYPSKTLSSGTSTIVQYYFPTTNNSFLEHGQSYCLSFWAKGSGKFRTYLYSSTAGSDPSFCHITKYVASDGTGGTASPDGLKTWTLTNEWQRYWIVYTFDTTGHFDNRRLLFRHDYITESPTFAGDFCGIKLEAGNKATDWSPAPEDVQAEIDAKKSVHTLDSAYSFTYADILTYSAEGYGASNSGANWDVASTIGVKAGDTVRIKVIASDMSNTPVYVVGTVTSIVSGTRLKMISHGLDTTVIDGGHILTGTLDATKVNVTNLNANNISSGTINTARLDANTIKSSIVQTTDLSADKITSGSIASDRIKANVINAVNNGTGTINADKINVSQINIGSLSGTIGGRNLLRNTVVSNLNREKCNFPSAYVSTTMTDGIICYKFTGNNTVHGFNYTDDWGCLSSPLKANTTYTYSFWAKYSKAANFNFTSYGHFQVNNSASAASDKTHEDVAANRVYSPSNVVANTWTRMSLTFTTNNLNGSSFGIFPLYNNGADAIMYAYGFKLEEGDRATDWTPAPEDSFGENIIRNVDATTVYSITMSSTESGSKDAFTAVVPRVSGENVYTVSFDAKVTSAQNAYCFWYSPNTTTFGKSSTRQTTTNADGSISISLTTAWQRYSITWVQSDTDATNKNLIIGRVFVPSSGSVTVSVRAVKMEVGAIANPWSDANNYITQADNNGIRIHPSSTQNNSVVINANGLEVFKGGTAAANSVAFYGDSARIGKQAAAHVDIASTSISMSDGTRTVYDVAQSSTAVKVTKIYNVTQSLGDSGFTDTIGLGRTVSNWTSIVLTYKVNSTTYTKSYSSLPIYDSSGGYAFNAELNGTTIKIDWFAGLTATASTKYTLVSVVFNFTTSQQVVESTLGAFANKTQSGVFRVGTGTANNALANGMLVDWGGNVRAGGDIVAYSNADSSGGVSLAKPTIIPYAYSYGSGSNTVSIGMYRVGKVVMLHIYFSKSSSTASGSNLFSINLSGAQFPEPAIDKLYGISGSTFYGAHAIGFLLIEDETASGIADDDPMGWYKLVIRNASNSSVTASGVGEGTLMYICK